MGFIEEAVENLRKLSKTTYPGRGIILGMSPDGKKYVQIYWIMGRSENSRNRVFIEENGYVKTKAFDEKKVTDPSLIIYYPVKNIANCHIVTNGDQTDTVYESIKNYRTFEDAMSTRTFEPDSPNFTPRISGIIDLDDSTYAYKLSVLKSIDNNKMYGQKNLFIYEKAIPGYGHCITTYRSDGNPLPSFDSEPMILPVYDDTDHMADIYWNTLDEENKVALMVKTINSDTGLFSVIIKNKLHAPEVK